MCLSSYFSYGQETVIDNNQFQKEIHSFIIDYFEAFNSCSADKTVKLLSDDFEFYHDLAGPVVGKDNMRNIIDDVCKRNNFDWIKTRLTGDPKLFQLKEGNKLYGAIVTGELLFYAVDKQTGTEIKESTSSFTWVLRLEGIHWKLTRDLSYNHHDLTSQK